jgi:hypothetical protein
MSVTKKNAGGRPKIAMGLQEVENLSRINCTMDELAAYFQVSVRTVQLRAQKERAFREAIERGQAMGRLSVRRHQIRLMEQGNPTMAIWLGKQLLGQRDKFETEVTMKDGDLTLEQLLATGAQLLALQKDKKK